MNDFTKEELLQLLSDMDYVKSYYGEEGINQELEDKLISMIDNYCEHDFIKEPS